MSEGTMEFIKPGPNKRVCAFLIDYFIVELIGIACITIFLKDSSWIVWFFGMVFRDCYNGQSIGKRVVGTQIIDEDGNPVEPFESIKRNITIVLPFLPLVEYIVLLRDKENGQRLGDKWAKTRVTDLKPEVQDSVYLWMSVALAVMLIASQMGFSYYLMKNHPELIKHRLPAASVKNPSATP